MSTALFWAAHSFDWPTLLSTLLSNKLFWELFLVIYSWEQFFEPSFERWNSFEHFFEHSQECTYSQEHFFEWIYSHECSFGHFLEGSRSTRTYLHLALCSFLFVHFKRKRSKVIRSVALWVTSLNSKGRQNLHCSSQERVKVMMMKVPLTSLVVYPLL